MRKKIYRGFVDRVWFRPMDGEPRPVGGLRIIKRHLASGMATVVFDNHNLVVDNGKKIMSRVISGLPEYAITHIAMGSGYDPDNPPTPNPDPEATELVAEELRIAVDLIMYPSDNSVTFRAIMDGETGNEVAFTEAGLIAGGAPADESLFAIRNHGVVSKTEEFVLEYNWTIVF